MLKNSEGKDTNEYLITRHNQFIFPINVINVYGEQESRTPSSVIKDHWEELVEEIIKIEAKNEVFILISDLNKHIGNLIEGNSDKISQGGRLVREFLASEKYILLNNSKKVEGGPFTREEPSDPTKKSCLDVIIMSEQLEKYVEKVIIDKDRKFTPCSISKNGRITYPDHFAIMILMKNIPMKKEKTVRPPKVIMWNTNKPGGWKRYYEETNANEVLDTLSENDKIKEDPQLMMELIEKHLN